MLAGTDSEKSRKTGVSFLVGYAKSTSSIWMRPAHEEGTSPTSLRGSISDTRSIVLNKVSAADAAFVSTMMFGAMVVRDVAAYISR
jgi:hypothetical protein